MDITVQLEEALKSLYRSPSTATIAQLTDLFEGLNNRKDQFRMVELESLFVRLLEDKKLENQTIVVFIISAAFLNSQTSETIAKALQKRLAEEKNEKVIQALERALRCYEIAKKDLEWKPQGLSESPTQKVVALEQPAKRRKSS